MPVVVNLRQQQSNARSLSVVNAYSKEAVREKRSLLTPSQEMHFGRLIQRSLKKEKAGKMITSAERHAFEMMVLCNLRLVTKVATRYSNKNSFLSIDDLVQHGTIGLIRAAKKFDPERGYRFSTYAHWWIDQEMKRAMSDYSRTIRLPSWVCEKLSKLNRLQQQLEQRAGRPLSDKEVAERMHDDTLSDLCEKLRKADRTTYSLNWVVDEEKDTTLGDTLSGEEGAEQTHLQKEVSALLDECLHRLSAREQEIIRRRVVDGETLQQVSDDLNVSRERIRQIQKKAFVRMREFLRKKGVTLQCLIN